MTKKQPTYTEEFKRQVVNLYRHGKAASELSKEYGLSKTSIYTWANYAENSGSFKTKDNRSVGETELIQLKKENKQLRMENDILKQAALIMARK